MKKISIRQFATIKRVAQNVNPLVTKKNKNLDKMEKLNAENMELEMEISGHEEGIKALTGGYSSEELVKKVVETTDKIDAKGQPVKVTKYVPTDLIEFNEEDNCYYINENNIIQDADFEDIDDTEKVEEFEVKSEEESMIPSNPFNEK